MAGSQHKEPATLEESKTSGWKVDTVVRHLKIIKDEFIFKETEVHVCVHVCMCSFKKMDMKIVKSTGHWIPQISSRLMKTDIVFHQLSIIHQPRTNNFSKKKI